MLRVKMHPAHGKKECDVVYLGIEVERIGEYDYVQEVEDLPEWIQERIAILMTCDPMPPTFNVDGVGRRVDENTYWVFDDTDTE